MEKCSAGKREGSLESGRNLNAPLFHVSVATLHGGKHLRRQADQGPRPLIPATNSPLWEWKKNPAFQAQAEKMHAPSVHPQNPLFSVDPFSLSISFRFFENAGIKERLQLFSFFLLSASVFYGFLAIFVFPVRCGLHNSRTRFP